MIKTKREQLIHLFEQHKVIDMPLLLRETERSQRTVFRYLKKLSHLSSYTHAGGYYTLKEIPSFDKNGIWRYNEIGFSRYGTLKDTISHLVESSDTGRTHSELQNLLQVRVQNSLNNLMQEKTINREVLGGSFVYISTDSSRAVQQLSYRHKCMEEVIKPKQPSIDPYIVIAILLEVIHSGHLQQRAITSRLRNKGIKVKNQEVTHVFSFYNLGKKN